DPPQPVELDVAAEPVRRVRSRLAGIDGVEAPHGRISALPPIEADERVPQDAEQPGLEVRARRELRGRAEGASVRLLDEILRIRGIPGEVACEVVEGIGIGERLAPQRDAGPGPLLVAHVPTISHRPDPGVRASPFKFATHDPPIRSPRTCSLPLMER